jgi:hypothetical protein
MLLAKMKLQTQPLKKVQGIYLVLLIVNIVLDAYLGRNLVESLILFITLFIIIKNFYFAIPRNLPLGLIRFFCLVVLTYLLPINFVFRLLILAAIFLIGSIVCRITKTSSGASNINLALALLAISKALILFLYNHVQVVFQFLTLGYDNALHFSLFRSFIETPWFPFVSKNDWSSQFTGFNSYPSGQSVLYSFFSSILLPEGVTVEMLVGVFFLLGIIGMVGVFLTVFQPAYKENKLKNFPLRFTLAAATSIMGAGILMTNGFPPYLLGIMIFLLWLKTVLDEDSGNTLIPTSMTIPVIQVVSPALLLFLFLPFIVMAFKYTSEILSQGMSRKSVGEILLLSPLLLATILFMQNTSGSAGWRQLLIPGGVQPPYLITYLLCMTIALAFIFGTRDFLKLALISSLVTTFTLIFLTRYITGSIQYYSIKQFYLLLVLVGFVSAYQLAKSYSKLNGFLALTLIVMMIFPAIRPNIFQGGFMGTIPKTMSDTRIKSEWLNEPVNSELVTANLKRLTGNYYDCIVYRDIPFDPDLTSRWLNAMTNKNLISDDCFSIFGNPSSIEMDELEERINQSKLKVLVLLDEEDFEVDYDAFKQGTVFFSTNGRIYRTSVGP